MTNKFGDRVKNARIQRGMTQTDLAKMVGISRQQITNYEKNDSTPKDSVMNMLSAALGVSIKWLETGDKMLEGHIIRGGVDFIRRPIPLISWEQAALMPNKLIDDLVYQWIFPPEDCGVNAFALKVIGESMEPEFTDGATIIVEPNIEPMSGDFVVAKFGKDDDITFKRLFKDAGKYYLRPTNLSYESIRLDNLSVIGVVTYVIKRVFRR